MRSFRFLFDFEDKASGSTRGQPWKGGFRIGELKVVGSGVVLSGSVRQVGYEAEADKDKARSEPPSQELKQ